MTVLGRAARDKSKWRRSGRTLVTAMAGIQIVSRLVRRKKMPNAAISPLTDVLRSIDRENHRLCRGEIDLRTGLVRAIGNAQERFTEINCEFCVPFGSPRFFNFRIESSTLAAMREMASQ